MTYSGTAVIHALILAADSMNSLYDIDAMGIWAVVSVGCLTFIPVILWSTTFPRQPSRPIFGFWGFLVSLGSGFAMIALLRDYPSEPECRSDNGTLLTSIAQRAEGYNCTYLCFGANQILRKSTDIAVVSKQRVFGSGMNLLITAMVFTVVFGIFLGIMTCWAIPRKRTEAELRAVLAQKNDGFTVKERRHIQALKRAAREELKTGELRSHKSRLGYLYPGLIILVIALNECYLLKDGGLPTSENPYAIGQWGPWVGVALALLAAIIVRYYRPRFLERQRVLDAERAAFELRTRNDVNSFGNNGVPVQKVLGNFQVSSKLRNQYHLPSTCQVWYIIYKMMLQRPPKDMLLRALDCSQ